MSDLNTLTPREREVLTLTARGLLSKEIATALGISIKTVDVHRVAIKRKLGGITLYGCAALAGKAGWV